MACGNRCGEGLGADDRILHPLYSERSPGLSTVGDREAEHLSAGAHGLGSHGHDEGGWAPRSPLLGNGDLKRCVRPRLCLPRVG